MKKFVVKCRKKIGEKKMAEEEKKKPRMFVRDLLFLDIILSTSLSNPKNSKEINKELEERWKEIFPDEPFPKMGAKTIINHVADMRDSKLYDIRHCNNTRLGYYNEGVGKFLLTPAETIVVTAALYRSPSISTEELTQMVRKIEVASESEGAAYFYFLNRQIKKFNALRKTKHKILPIINQIWANIMEREPKKISFNYCTNDASSERNRPLKYENNKPVKFTVSPYFFVFESDELYLIANIDKNNNFTHFKVSLIENLKIIEEKARPIREITDYIFYELGEEKFLSMKPYEVEEYREDLKQSRERDRGGVTIKFPLDRYLQEHVYLSDGEDVPRKIEILFSEDIKDKILTRFGLNLKITPTGESWTNQKVFRATLTAQINEGLYQFFMQFGDKIKIISPAKIREELKRKFLSALKMLD